MLRADKHFDSILNEKEEEDLGAIRLYYATEIQSEFV